jgi:glutamine synthetase
MTRETLADNREFDKFVAAHPDIGALDVFIIDVNGNTIGKRLSMAEGRSVFENGVAFSACAPILDNRGRGHNPLGIGNSDGDPDGIALPLAGTLRRMPWARAPTAQVMCVMHEAASRSPLWFDPRVILQNVVHQCREQEIFPVLACELEFYLVDRHRTSEGQLQAAAVSHTGAVPRRAMSLSLEGIEDSADLLSQITDSAREQGVPVSGVVSEYGISQYEVNLKHVADPLLAADHAVLLKRIVKGTARSRGIDATFMAKPFTAQPGSGLHVHVSLVTNDGSNRFGATGGDELLRQAVGGMQAMVLDSIGFFAPNFNSFRRCSAAFVAAAATWGHNNRSVAFRVPSGSPQNRRIEHRISGADASPHLAVAAILASILHGVSNKLVATTATEGRVSAVRDPSSPSGLLAALDRLERSALLAQYVPPRYLQAYAQLKRGEYDALMEDIFPRELDFFA